MSYNPKEDFDKSFSEAKNDTEKWNVVLGYKDIIDYKVWIDNNDLYLEINDESNTIYQFEDFGIIALSDLLDALKVNNSII